MTEVMQVREAYRAEQWRQLMQQRRESPLNNREFCAQQGISEKSYYYWLKKLRESAAEHGIPQLVALEDSGKPDGLRIEYHGAGMVLPGHVDIAAVAAVLRSLQQA
jgi:putative transposase